jgi:hypothetical protein
VEQEQIARGAEGPGALGLFGHADIVALAGAAGEPGGPATVSQPGRLSPAGR